MGALRCPRGHVFEPDEEGNCRGCTQNKAVRHEGLRFGLVVGIAGAIVLGLGMGWIWDSTDSGVATGVTWAIVTWLKVWLTPVFRRRYDERVALGDAVMIGVEGGIPLPLRYLPDLLFWLTLFTFAVMAVVGLDMRR